MRAGDLRTGGCACETRLGETGQSREYWSARQELFPEDHSLALHCNTSLWGNILIINLLGSQLENITTSRCTSGIAVFMMPTPTALSRCHSGWSAGKTHKLAQHVVLRGSAPTRALCAASSRTGGQRNKRPYPSLQGSSCKFKL